MFLAESGRSDLNPLLGCPTASVDQSFDSAPLFRRPANFVLTLTPPSPYAILNLRPTSSSTSTPAPPSTTPHPPPAATKVSRTLHAVLYVPRAEPGARPAHEQSVFRGETLSLIDRIAASVYTPCPAIPPPAAPTHITGRPAREAP